MGIEGPLGTGGLGRAVRRFWERVNRNSRQAGPSLLPNVVGKHAGICAVALEIAIPPAVHEDDLTLGIHRHLVLEQCGRWMRFLCCLSEMERDMEPHANLGAGEMFPASHVRAAGLVPI
jgi:hypothetical protein